MELSANLANVHVFPSLERVGRCSRGDPKPGQLAQRVCQFVGHTVAEIFVSGITADVCEGQHGNGAELSHWLGSAATAPGQASTGSHRVQTTPTTTIAAATA